MEFKHITLDPKKPIRAIRKEQLQMSRFALKVEHPAILATMGIGKTLTILHLIQLMKNLKIPHRTLVVASKKIVSLVWPVQAVEWSDLYDVTCVDLRDKGRVAALHSTSDIYAVNRESLNWLTKELNKFDEFPFDNLVIDESTYFKNPNMWNSFYSKTKKEYIDNPSRFNMLLQLAPHFKKRIIMTATIRPKSYIDLWAQFQLLNPKVFNMSYDQFLSKWFKEFRPPGQKYSVFSPIKGAKEHIQKTIAPHCIVFDKSHVDLPPRNDIDIKIQLTDKLMSQYKKLTKDLFLQAEEGVVDAKNRAVLSGKLCQFVGGYMYEDTASFDMFEDEDDDRNTKKYFTVHKQKLDALEAIIEDGCSRALILYEYRNQAKEIAKLLKKLKVKFADFSSNLKAAEEQELQMKWDKGQIDFFIAHGMSCGHGLNLQKKGGAVIFFNPYYSWDLTEQSIARMVRPGAPGHINVFRLICPGTVDEVKIERNQGDDDEQRLLEKALKMYGDKL